MKFSGDFADAAAPQGTKPGSTLWLIQVNDLQAGIVKCVKYNDDVFFTGQLRMRILIMCHESWYSKYKNYDTEIDEHSRVKCGFFSPSCNEYCCALWQ